MKRTNCLYVDAKDGESILASIQTEIEDLGCLIQDVIVDYGGNEALIIYTEELDDG
jgi:hypothetical protein